MRKKTDSQIAFEGFVKEVAGVQGLKVVKSIDEEGATDEKIEKASGLKLATVRSLLNQLNYCGVVEYTREKNMQSGWFTYTWKVNKSRAMQNFLSRKKGECEELRAQLAKQGEETVIYCCPKGCERYFFDTAVENGFACIRCKTKLRFIEGTKELQTLEKRINALENLLRMPNVF